MIDKVLLTRKNDKDFCKYVKSLKDSANIHIKEFKKLIRISSSYALSLVNKKDNLTHWNNYGNNGKGVCIAFNINSLKVLDARLVLCRFGNDLFDMKNIIYGKDSCIKYLNSILDNYYNEQNREN
jgi:predicted transcriptional regulator